MENILFTVSELLESAPAWLVAISGIVTSASALAALTPTPKDDALLGKIGLFLKRVINLLALNVGNAKPK